MSLHRAADSGQHFDVLVVGAGISGIAAGFYLQKHCPHKTYAILESREAIGGTWDLWRYPGCRSDSDMYTFGFSFKPWEKGLNISPAKQIRAYLHETVQETGIARHILCSQHVKHAAFSSSEALWRLQTVAGDCFSCNYLLICGGYYKYDGGFVPKWPGMDGFQGKILRPMAWPSDFDASGQKMVVIGSGATAASMVPVLARHAKHVTMLQRSPGYMSSVASAESRSSTLLRAVAPGGVAHFMIRSYWIFSRVWQFWAVKAAPGLASRLLIWEAMWQLPAEVSREHFTPRYAPWDQRVCGVTDGDLFKAISSGAASVVTDTIKEFTDTGILLSSGKTLEADVIVAATGFNFQSNFPMSDMEVTIDGQAYDASQTLLHRGMMLSGVPNFAFVLGYTNASWTLRAELVCERFCKLLRHMDAKGYAQFRPVRDSNVEEMPGGFGALNSGYIERARGQLPKAGSKSPWKAHPENYIKEQLFMNRLPFEDKCLEFVPGRPRSKM